MGDVGAGLMDARRRDGSEGAEQLVERHGDRLYRLALRITGVEEDAVEVVGDALRTVAAAIEPPPPDESVLGAWIYRTAARVAYEKLRSRRPPLGDVSVDDVAPRLAGGHFAPMEDWSPRIDAPALPERLGDVLAEAIDALPADYRTALVLHDVEGASKSDVAEILGIDVSGVKSRVHRARLFVRRRLSEYFAAGGAA
ncbi:MAG TPA: RNA polymerase sigma factor [Methylomirabilota bacterium]|nr:RNA polymerase sigma factor [Methylomirabilota bacterium]